MYSGLARPGGHSRGDGGNGMTEEEILSNYPDLEPGEIREAADRRGGWTGVSGGRSGPVARNLVGPEQQSKTPEDIAHFGRPQDADPVTKSRLIDGSDLGYVYDARTRKASFTLP